MRKLKIITSAVLAVGIALSSAPSFAQDSSVSNAPATKNVKHTKTHQLAQGPAGLNGGNAAGPGMAPWAGPANGLNNPVSGSRQDPGMHGPLTPSSH